MPTSAFRKAGASFTPSPVTATIARFFFQRADDAHFLFRKDASKHDLRGVERELELAYV